MKKKLATLGYGMLASPSKNITKSEIFRETVLRSNIQLLIETRFSPWGGFWNPKKISEILRETNIQYIYEWNNVRIHKLFGVPKNIRELRPFDSFSTAYQEHIATGQPNPITTFSKVLDSFPNTEKVAILCCEPFIPTLDNCHRFILAEMLQKNSLVDVIEHLSMDETFRVLNQG